jgi:hypothetical protein
MVACGRAAKSSLCHDQKAVVFSIGGRQLQCSTSPKEQISVADKNPDVERDLDLSKGAYVVVKRLPKHNGEFEYQIKSVSGIGERIVRERELKPSPWRNQSGRPYSA